MLSWLGPFLGPWCEQSATRERPRQVVRAAIRARREFQQPWPQPPMPPPRRVRGLAPPRSALCAGTECRAGTVARTHRLLTGGRQHCMRARALLRTAHKALQSGANLPRLAARAYPILTEVLASARIRVRSFRMANLENYSHSWKTWPQEQKSRQTPGHGDRLVGLAHAMIVYECTHRRRTFKPPPLSKYGHFVLGDH